jgi:lipopolysaccharide/colanic/teichoic acid biosynthesis glycosyltransferase
LKRFFDFVISLFALLLMAPLLLTLALLVRLFLGSPVIFKQQRPGLKGQPFTLYKFRTMRDTFSDLGEPLPDELRLTRFGRWLRASSLDELPEIWNVLCGEMSLVGPRPLLMEYLPMYSPQQARRHEVRPGITGWAQVNGRNELSWQDRLTLDEWYVDNHSIRLDIKILWLTLATVLSRHGVSHQGHASMPKFNGQTDTED